MYNAGPSIRSFICIAFEYICHCVIELDRKLYAMNISLWLPSDCTYCMRHLRLVLMPTHSTFTQVSPKKHSLAIKA